MTQLRDHLTAKHGRSAVAARLFVTLCLTGIQAMAARSPARKSSCANSFDGVLFTHWRDDYTAILDELLDNRFTSAAIQAELERVSAVAAAAFDADPYVTGTAADAVASLQQYWAERLADVRVEVP